MRALHLIPALLAGISLFPISSRATDAKIRSAAIVDSCGPSFLDIYNFQVGDVFQYSKRFGVNGHGGSFEGKYGVLSKEALRNGFRYQVAGLTGQNTTESPVRTYGQTSEIWEFADSTARRNLDGCKDKIVPLTAPGPDIYSFGSMIPKYYTRIKIWPGDTLDFRLPNAARLKILGNVGDLRQSNLYMDTTGRPALENPQCMIAYAAGLGMVRTTYNIGEETGELRLSGYVRNGVTVGTIYPDSYFGVTISVRARPIRARSTSDVVRSTRTGPLFISAGKPGMRNLIGRQTATFSARAFP